MTRCAVSLRSTFNVRRLFSPRFCPQTALSFSSQTEMMHRKVQHMALCLLAVCSAVAQDHTGGEANVAKVTTGFTWDSEQDADVRGPRYIFCCAASISSWRTEHIRTMPNHNGKNIHCPSILAPTTPYPYFFLFRLVFSFFPGSQHLSEDRLNFKPRTTVTSMAELDRFLNDQLVKDEMSVIVSFFEPDQLRRREPAYLNYLKAGGIPQNAMMAFALCTVTFLPFPSSGKLFQT